MSTESETIISIKVAPRSSRNRIMVTPDGVFKVFLTAPPVEGKANEALIHLVAKTLGIAKNRVTIVSGEHAKHKKIAIEGMEREDVMSIIIP